MTAIAATTVRCQTMADGTLRVTLDIEPGDAAAGFAMCGVPGRELAVTGLKPDDSTLTPSAEDDSWGGSPASDARRQSNEVATTRMRKVLTTGPFIAKPGHGDKLSPTDFSRRVIDMPLSVRARNGLIFAGIMTEAQLAEKAPAELLNIPGLGHASLREIRNVIGTSAEQSVKPKGGPLAKLAGQWREEPGFAEWLYHNFRIGIRPGELDGDYCRRCVLEICNIADRKDPTRAELDHNPQAAAAFHTLIREPFAEYLKTRAK